MLHRIWMIACLVGALTCLPARSQGRVAPRKRSKAEMLGTYTLPRTSLSQFGNPAITDEVLKRARRNGLEFTDLPSIGSGLARVGENEFVGITDRGPNGKVKGDDDDSDTRRTFPLPEFCPTIVRFKLSGRQILITGYIPLRDSTGKLISGLSNVEGEERLYESPEAKTPLPLDPDGVDPESIRVLPDGNFLLSEEYSPSILVVSPNGQVLVRYTPASKPLAGATYPVKPILPPAFAHRRDNKGFENLALSRDGRFAYAILQSPMGDVSDKALAKSRVLRVLKLDVSHPLEATVVGEYLALAGAARDYSARQKQQKISWSDAEWLAPDRLLVIERGKGQVKLLVVDLSRATNILHHADEGSLVFEKVTTDLATLGVQPARSHEVFSTREVRGIDSDKIEGITRLNATDVALSNDNDFGIGENRSGELSTVWLVRIPTLPAFAR